MGPVNNYEFDVFLSHSSRDDDVVRSLGNRLSADRVRVWIDDDQIGYAAPIHERVQQGLLRSRRVFLFWSENASRSDWARAEISSVLAPDPLNRSGRFLPVRLDDAAMPPLLLQFRCIDWRRPTEEAYQELRRVCQANLEPSAVSEGWLMREHTAPVRSVAVTADGSLAVSGSEDRTVRVWNLRDGRCTAVFGDHTDIVHCVAVTGDGRFAISGSKDGTVRVWDLNVKRCIRTLGGHASAVWSVAVTGDGLRHFSGTADGTVRVWSLGSSDPIAVHEGRTGAVYGLAVAATPDGQRVVAGTANDVLRVLDVDSSGSFVSISDNRGRGFSIKGVAVTANGSRAVSCDVNKNVKVWSLQNGAWIGDLTGHGAWVSGVAVTPDGRRVIACSADKTLRIWDPDTTDCVEILKGHDAAVTGVAVTPNGRCVVSCSHDESVRVWNAPEISTPIIVPFDAGVDVILPDCSPKNLCWGRAIYRPGAGLRYHTHPVDEIIVVLRGRLPVWVEGRRYELGRLDAIYIPQTSAAEGGRTATI